MGGSRGEFPDSRKFISMEKFFESLLLKLSHHRIFYGERGLSGQHQQSVDFSPTVGGSVFFVGEEEHACEPVQCDQGDNERHPVSVKDQFLLGREVIEYSPVNAHVQKGLVHIQPPDKGIGFEESEKRCALRV